MFTLFHWSPTAQCSNLQVFFACDFHFIFFLCVLEEDAGVEDWLSLELIFLCWVACHNHYLFGLLTFFPFHKRSRSYFVISPDINTLLPSILYYDTAITSNRHPALLLEGQQLPLRSRNLSISPQRLLRLIPSTVSKMTATSWQHRSTLIPWLCHPR